MISITDAVRDIVTADITAHEALRMGIVNCSTYARYINPHVEEITMKEVKTTSIATILQRLMTEYERMPQPRRIVLSNISMHANLWEWTYERTAASIGALRLMHEKIPNTMHTFFTTTRSMNEITIIAHADMRDIVESCFAPCPQVYKRGDLVGITGKFDINYLEQPNVIYAISSRLAQRMINVIEIVSTLTEITYIVDKKDAEVTIAQLSRMM